MNFNVINYENMKDNNNQNTCKKKKPVNSFQQEL